MFVKAKFWNTNLLLDERFRDEDIDESGTSNVQLSDNLIFGHFSYNLGGDVTRICFDTLPLKNDLYYN